MPFLQILARCAASLLFLTACSVNSKTLDLKEADAEASKLANAAEWTIYSLNTTVLSEEEQQSEHHFHGWEVLGEATLSSEKERADLTRALNRGIAENGDTTMAACFGPRHGISVQAPRGTVDLVICFECLQIRVYGEDGEQRATTLTMSDPSVVFNQIWRKHGLNVLPTRR